MDTQWEELVKDMFCIQHKLKVPVTLTLHADGSGHISYGVTQRGFGYPEMAKVMLKQLWEQGYIN